MNVSSVVYGCSSLNSPTAVARQAVNSPVEQTLCDVTSSMLEVKTTRLPSNERQTTHQSSNRSAISMLEEKTLLCKTQTQELHSIYLVPTDISCKPTHHGKVSVIELEFLFAEENQEQIGTVAAPGKETGPKNG